MEDRGIATSPAVAERAAQIETIARKLKSEMEAMEQRHQRERNTCLDNWLRRHEQALSGLQANFYSLPSSLPAEPPACSLPALDGPRPITNVFQISTAYATPDSPHSKNNGTAVVPVEPDSQEAMTIGLETQKTTQMKKKPKRGFRIVSHGDGSYADISRLQKFTNSRIYEVLSGVLIIINAASIGYQTQYLAQLCQELGPQDRSDEIKDPDSFLVMQIIFCILFTIELGLRWVADGFLEFFRSNDKYWVWFDVFVVAFSILDVLLTPFTDKDSSSGEVLGNISVLRIMRVIRIVRVAKVIRVMRFFKELRQMIFSILGSIKSLVWSLMVLTMLFFICGISLVTGVTEHMSQPGAFDDSQNDAMADYFGTLDVSILSLYMSMSGGNDWGMYYEALEQLPFQYRLFFLMFISFAIFAVVNIVTGIFVESALSTSNNDKEIIVYEEMESKKTYQDAMREFFEEADEDGTGTMGFDEFKKKLNDDIVIAYLNAFKLDVSDANMLFTLLDYDQSGEIQIEEFLDGCFKLQGQSSALDMKITQMEVKWLREAVKNVSELLQKTLASDAVKAEQSDEVKHLIQEAPRPKIEAERADLLAPCYVQDFNGSWIHADISE